MSDAERYHALVAELREVVIRLHGGELFSKKGDAELIRKLEDAGRALRKTRKNGTT